RLMVGRNGLFYDRTGVDWDATIVKLVEHAISVREAFWSPYKRRGGMIGQQIEKFAGARDKAVVEGGANGLGGLVAKSQADAASAPKAFDIGKFAGIFAAIGLAVGAIGTALAVVLTGFFGLAFWQMPLALVGLVLLISGPSMLIASMNLRRRNLGPILDANGWAVNAQAKINIPFGATLTRTARLPKGSARRMQDPFAEERRPWGPSLILILLLLIGAGWALGQQGYLRPLWEQLQDGIQQAMAPAKPESKSVAKTPAKPDPSDPSDRSARTAAEQHPAAEAKSTPVLESDAAPLKEVPGDD
ncbi:MAG: hypothetical protein WBG92_07205, partial [Thiohalocapsa sp.]